MAGSTVTPTGCEMFAARDFHDPECPRWKHVGDPDAPCECALPDNLAAIEAEARADALRDAAERVARLPEPTLGLKGGVNRAAVLAILTDPA